MAHMRRNTWYDAGDEVFTHCNSPAERKQLTICWKARVKAPQTTITDRTPNNRVTHRKVRHPSRGGGALLGNQNRYYCEYNKLCSCDPKVLFVQPHLWLKRSLIETDVRSSALFHPTLIFSPANQVQPGALDPSSAPKPPDSLHISCLKVIWLVANVCFFSTRRGFDQL